jgi:hypothetical protein
MNTTYIEQMAFDNISVVIRLHSNTIFAYSISIPLLMSFAKPFWQTRMQAKRESWCSSSYSRYSDYIPGFINRVFT